MTLKIDRDQNRFRQIVRGKIRENLRQYVNHGELIGRKGRDLVSMAADMKRTSENAEKELESNVDGEAYRKHCFV